MIEKIGLESPAYIGGAMTLLASVLFPLLLKRDVKLIKRS
jgi:hypothetical protein